MAVATCNTKSNGRQERKERCVTFRVDRFQIGWERFSKSFGWRLCYGILLLIMLTVVLVGLP
jgi:hypothetical protein